LSRVFGRRKDTSDPLYQDSDRLREPEIGLWLGHSLERFAARKRPDPGGDETCRVATSAFRLVRREAPQVRLTADTAYAAARRISIDETGCNSL
jgi:hypothetical protein